MNKSNEHVCCNHEEHECCAPNHPQHTCCNHEGHECCLPDHTN